MTATQFIEDIANRLDGEYSKADVRKVLVAVAEELQGALADGYKVSIAGVGRFEPRAKAGRKKGDLIRTHRRRRSRQTSRRRSSSRRSRPQR
jgi:nucleoid DNA-binding protein